MKKRKLIITILVIFLLAALAVYWGLKNSDGRFNIQESYQLEFKGPSVQMIPVVFHTNSTKITVTSVKGQPPVYIHLYYGGETDHIMEFQLNGGETKSFNNLVSTCRYMIGVKSAEADSQSILLEVEYRPLER